jgi:DNA-binding SARP family transcriptional activator
MIHLHTLGDSLITIGETDIRPSSPMVFAALLYLGVERGRRVPRAALRELLFPDASERSGAHSVRQLLYKLRQLGASLNTNATSVRMDEGCVHDDCIFSDTEDWADGQVATASLGFVPEYAPAFSERYSLWLERQRAIVTGRLRTTLVSLLVRRRAQSHWSSTTAIAHSLLSVDPLNEEATLALAEATAAMGGKHKAITLLSDYETETDSALRIAPALLRRRISETLAHLPGDHAGVDPLVGRAQELSAIATRIKEPRESGARISVIAGEAGIGKTRLLEEILRSAAVTGTRPLLARCRPHHQNRPLSAFIEIVPVLLKSPGALGINPESLRYLRTLLDKDSGDATSNDFDDDAGRVEVLRRAISDLIDAVQCEHRIALAFEDVHWCDAVSLVELRLIASKFPAVPIVCTSRSLENVKRDFADLGEVFRLLPLARDHTSLIARHLLGDSTPQETQDWCVDVAAGNPLFLRILCRHVLENGTRTVPQDLTTVISSRLTLLPDLALRALHYVALLGSYASLTTLQDLLGVPPRDFIDCVASLEDQGYLATREGRLVVSHDLLSDVALTLAPPVTKQVLHAHVAAYLERQLDVTGNTSVLWDCAEQWRLSGEHKKSFDLLRRCAAHASALGYSGKALEILTHAREFLTDPKELPSVLNEMVLAAKAAGQLTEIGPLFKQIQTIALESHSEAEILAFEAEWLLDGRMDINHLLGCVESEALPTQHRLDACLLLLRYAHESCDAQLGHRGYGSIRRILGSAETAQRLMIDIVYRLTFGDSRDAVALINALTAITPTLSVGEQFRAAHTVVMGLLISGDPDQAIARANSQRLRARELGLVTREFEFTSLICACYLAIEDYSSGEVWMAHLATAPDSRWSSLHATLQIEMALWRKDAATTASLLASLEPTPIGRLDRDRMYLAGVRLRLRQLDADFVCSEGEFSDLLVLYGRCKKFITEDGLARALAEDLRRRHRPRDAAALLDDYVNNARRQCWLLPESFRELRARLEIEATTFSVA